MAKVTIRQKITRIGRKIVVTTKVSNGPRVMTINKAVRF